MKAKACYLTLILLIFIANTAMAESPFSNAEFKEAQYKSRISEFFFSPSGTDMLQPVKLLGKVSKPGLYHIPAKTNLTTLLTISGGIANNANTNEITVTSLDGKNRQMDLNELIKSGQDITLTTGDIVYIPEKSYLFDQPTVSAITSVTSILGIILTAIVISQ